MEERIKEKFVKKLSKAVEKKESNPNKPLSKKKETLIRLVKHFKKLRVKGE